MKKLVALNAFLFVLLLLVLPVVYKNGDEQTKRLSEISGVLCITVIVCSAMYVLIAHATKPIVRVSSNPHYAENSLETENETTDNVPAYLERQATQTNLQSLAIRGVAEFNNMKLLPEQTTTTLLRYLRNQLTLKQCEALDNMMEFATYKQIITVDDKIAVDALWPNGQRSRVPAIEAEYWTIVQTGKPLPVNSYL